jgi:hypothetical protein
LTDANHHEWNQLLPHIAFALRTAIHDSTGFVPAFLNFGRFLPLNGGYYGDLDDKDIVELSWSSAFYAQKMQEHPAIYHQVRQRLADAYERQAIGYNKGKRPAVQFKVGDLVWKRHFILSSGPHGFSSKLAPRFIPCRIAKVISPLIYDLDHDDGSPAGRWHVKDLKSRIDAPEPEHSSNDSESEDSDADFEDALTDVVDADEVADTARVAPATEADPPGFASDDSIFDLFD